MRQEIELDGLWQFVPDPHADGEDNGFWKKEFDARKWGKVAVPSCFEAACENLDFYEGIVWYRRMFNLKDSWREKRIVLRFEGVNYRTKVWLNGIQLGVNLDGFLPFEFEIQEHVRLGNNNVLTVSVDNSHHSGDVPGMHVGWRGFGGILREVSLYATERCHIAKAKVLAEPEGSSGKMRWNLRIRNADQEKNAVVASVKVFDAKGVLKAEILSNPTLLVPGAETEVILEGGIASATAWSPEKPVLYHAKLTLACGARCDGGKIEDMDKSLSRPPTGDGHFAADIADTIDIRFGFRKIEATADRLLLNGKPIFLKGFNRHEDSPRTDMATDLETVRKDLEMMKKVGSNCVRLCHYPHHPKELDLCDELGLLVFSEVPLYFWNDMADGEQTNAERAKTALRQLKTMIERDFNHPSIIFWAVSNETHEDYPAVVESNRLLIRSVKKLDPSRLVVHVSNHWIDAPNFEEDDVICINHYPSIEWARRGHNPATYEPESFRKILNANLMTLRQKFPSKAVLVTEFGYSSFIGTYGHSFGEDEHARVLETEYPAVQESFVCSALVWCWADHAWAALRFHKGLAVSPFGVITRKRRIKKMPFNAIRRLFRTDDWPLGRKSDKQS